jgi:hypothetical protein
MSNVTDTARQQNLTDLFTTAIEGVMGTGLAKLATASPQRRTACGTTFAALSRRLGSDDFPDFDATDADTIAQWALGLTSVWADGRRVELFG